MKNRRTEFCRDNLWNCRFAVGVAPLLLAANAFAQQPARLEFEAASLKLNARCDGGGGHVAPGRLTLECTPLRALIRAAYSLIGDDGKIVVRQAEVLEGPSWLDSDRYDLNAKAADPNAPVGQMTSKMLQQLLEERCRLKVHEETREVPVYALTVMKSGAKMYPAREGSCTPVDLNHLPGPPNPGEPQRSVCGRVLRRSTNGTRMIAEGRLTLAEFAGRMLLNSVDRPVIDKTGLVGMFDFHLEYTRQISGQEPGFLNRVDASNTSVNAPDIGEPSIFTEIQEQLGLKLSPAQGSVKVLVIDSVERPSEN